MKITTTTTIIIIIIKSGGNASRICYSWNGLQGLERGQEKSEIGRRIETILTTALLRSARILRRVQETCCHYVPSKSAPANAVVKTL